MRCSGSPGPQSDRYQAPVYLTVLAWSLLLAQVSYVTSKGGRERRFCLSTHTYNVNTHLKQLSTMSLINFTCGRDLENVSSEDLVIRRTLVYNVRDACINVGFLYGTYCLCVWDAKNPLTLAFRSKEPWHPGRYYSGGAVSVERVFLSSSRRENGGKAFLVRP